MQQQQTKLLVSLALERERKELARIQEAIRQEEIAKEQAIALAIAQAQAQSQSAQQVAYVPPAPVVVTPTPKPTPAPKPVVVKPSRQTRAS
jgi:uncharacterized protein YggE